VEHDQELDPRPAGRHRPPLPGTDRAPGMLGSLAPAGNSALTRLLRGPVQRSAAVSQGAGELDPEIGSAIAAEQGGGSPLPAPLRSEMEHHLGVGLDAVRVHTGGRADELSRSVQADAFTSGTDIFFGGGRYDPGSGGGRELIAHELAHVVQQGTGAGGPEGTVSHPHDPAELQAAEVGRSIGSAPALDLTGGAAEESVEDAAGASGDHAGHAHGPAGHGD
jgi:hypothetical protein